MVTIEREKLEQVLEALGRYQVKRQDFDRFAAEITVIKQTLAQPAPPPECKTKAEQTAYAFGWWKALESVKAAQESMIDPGLVPLEEHIAELKFWKNKALAQPAQEPVGVVQAMLEGKDFTISKPWVGLTDEDIALIDWESMVTKKDCVRAIEAKLKEKNT